MFGVDNLDLEAAYRRLPIPFSTSAVASWGGTPNGRGTDTGVQRILGEAVARTYWSAEELSAFRNRRLIAHVEHAATRAASTETGCGKPVSSRARS